MDEQAPEGGEPLNREQRRSARFRPNKGRPDPHAVEGSATPLEDESAGRGGDDQAAFTGGRGTDVTRQTGPGTGGGTEPEGRLVHHEGTHLGHVPNS